MNSIQKPAIRTGLVWTARILAALILLQTLFFKFNGAAESVYIFSKLGVEPRGRIGSGVAELIAALLILFPATTAWGALLALGIMSGAIFAHLFVLGISVLGDGGQLFIYALIVWLCSCWLAWIHRAQIPLLNKYLPKANH
jgi:putative oxidoreductase